LDALEHLAARSDRGFPNLIDARERTERGLAELRGRLAGLDHNSDAGIALFGSWARGELTTGSDYDWAILVDGGEREEIRPGRDQLAGVLSGAVGPGAQGVFGATVFCDHLVDRIGLDADDNSNLTRRMLLLLESVGVLNLTVRDDCRDRVLAGYLADSLKDYRPPRFFLNDLIRYWRTICVDFVGKEREGHDEKWALRNLKLGTSRKILFAGGLLPILLCHRYRATDFEPFLRQALDRTSVDRIAWAFVELGAEDTGIRTITAYDRFLQILNDSAAREELSGLSPDDAHESDLFEEGRRLGRDVDQGLLALLFETRIEPLVREYGIF
jgi:Nucleotidyltransferase domain